MMKCDNGSDSTPPSFFKDCSQFYTEEWRNTIIPHIQVSSYGRVKDLHTGNIIRFMKTNRYHSVHWVTKDNTWRSFYVHRLLAEAFVPNPNGFCNVRFIDKDIDNIQINNLKWFGKTKNTPYSKTNRVRKAQEVAQSDTEVEKRARFMIYCPENN
jgi:hypothetical protein